MDATATKEFLELAQKNPDLPIVAMVDSEIVADDGYSWWLGSFKSASVDEYVSVEMYGDDVSLRGTNKIKSKNIFSIESAMNGKAKN